MLSGLRTAWPSLGVMLGLSCILLIWTGLYYALLAERAQAIAAASQNTANLARAFEESTLRSLKAIDQSLLYIRQAYRQDPAGFDMVAWARDTQSLTDMTFQISRIDRNGILASSNFAPNGSGIDLSDREHFRVQRDSAVDELFISKPVTGRASNKPSIQLTRKIFTADGVFDGVVVVSLDPLYLSRFYHSIDIGLDGLIALVGTDGIIRAAALGAGNGGMAVGTSIARDSLLAAFAHERAGTLLTSSSLDGIRRVESFRGVRGFPLFVSVGIAEAEILAVHEANRRSDMMLAALLTVLLLAVMTLVVRRQTDLKRARAALRDSQEQYADKSRLLEATLEAMSQGIVMVDAQHRPQVFNQRALELLALLPLDMKNGGSAPFEIDDPLGDFDTLLASAEPDRIRPNPVVLPLREIVSERRLNNGMLLEVRTRVLADGGRLQTYTDITARAAAEEMLGAAAGLDYLTGLSNRNGFGPKLEAALLAAQRTGQPLSVLCLDLDYFKNVNDTLGHEAGDTLLKLVARRMRDVLRDTDVVARLGGDEFALVLNGRSRNAVEHAARMLLDSLALPYLVNGELVRIGASIGVAFYPTDGATVELLLRNADTALYEAKSVGRNAWRAYASEDGLRERHRAQMELDLREAVETQQFTLAYQPICDTQTGQPVAFEALLRWNHKQRGPTSPAEFIPVAEQTGLIVPLGRWVIETACAEAATWARPMHVAVNLSPSWFRGTDLLAHLAEVLRRTGLAPERLDLEVTEGVLLEKSDHVISIMQSLRGMGVRMVLDDFGSAHSSLSYLRNFPFDQVKIDRSFMRALNSDRQARALVEAMLAMARALGLEVVAEGVETQEQLAMLRHMKCGNVQGFLLGRPQTAEITRQGLWASGGQDLEAQDGLIG